MTRNQWYRRFIATLVLGTVAILVLESFAWGQDVRKIDFTQVITNQDGEPLKECTKDEETSVPGQRKCIDFTPITLGMLSLRALTVQYPQEAAVTGEDQIRRAILAEAIYKNTSVTLDGKDTTLICDAIAKFVSKTGQNMLITLRAWQIIDPARTKK